MSTLPKGSSKLLHAWAFYDWANSVYSLVIASAIFPIFYTSLFKNDQNMVVFAGIQLKSSALISFVTAAAFLLVAVISPVLSGIADYLGNKKFFLKFFCYLGAGSCISLYWFSLENLYFGLLSYFFGLVGFWASLVFYNAFLPEIAHPEQQDQISAKGFALGYIGGVILLVLNLAMVLQPDFFGITDGIELASIKAMRFSFVLVGLWWIIFSQYTYYYLPSKTMPSNRIPKDVFLNGFRELKKVFYIIKEQNKLLLFLVAFFVYSMAVQTVMLVATYFGAKEIKWSSDDEGQIGLIICILLIQLVAVVGAILTSKASEKYGNIPVLIVLNMFWMSLCICAFFIYEPSEFYAMAACVGLVMGGIQSLSRSTYSKMLPPTQDTASFFSFYDVAEKIGIVIGMMLYGYIVHLYDEGPRYSIVFLTLFFFVGLVLLVILNYQKCNPNSSSNT